MDNSEIQIRHNRIRSKTLVYLALALIFSTLVLALLAPDKSLIPLKVTVSLVCAVFIIAGNYIWREKPYVMHITLYTILVFFIVYIFACRDPYMYAIMYPIALFCVFFMDKKIAVKGAAGCIVLYGIRTAADLVSAGGQNVAQTIGQYVFCVLTSVSAVVIVFVISNQNKEDMDLIKENANKVEVTSGKIVETAAVITNNVNNADELVKKLTTSIETNTSSVSEIAESTKTTAESIEQQTIMTGEIQSNLENASEHASEMNSLSDETVEVVKEGSELLRKLKESSEAAAKINEQTQESTRKLNDSIAKVGEIIKTILSISGQTNLLALNASIEAARAGDAGRGFAVVADEIRNLAEDTRRSTEQITAIIDELTEEVESARVNMQESVRTSEQQNEMIIVTGEKFGEINEKMGSLAKIVGMTNDEIHNIIQANSKIIDSITNLSAISEESAAASETSIGISNEVKANMEELSLALVSVMDATNDMKEAAK